MKPCKVFSYFIEQLNDLCAFLIACIKTWDLVVDILNYGESLYSRNSSEVQAMAKAPRRFGKTVFVVVMFYHLPLWG